MKFTFNLRVNLGILDDVDLQVRCRYAPGTPDVRHLPNGDPGDPGTSAGCEILSVTYQDADVTALFQDSDAFSDRCEIEAAFIYLTKGETAELPYEE
jgi:hypothetical protein